MAESMKSGPEQLKNTNLDENFKDLTSSGLIAKSDNVSEAYTEEILANNSTENTENDVSISEVENRRKGSSASRSTSLTSSVHEMVDDLTKLKIESTDIEDDEFQGKKHLLFDSHFSDINFRENNFIEKRNKAV